MTPEPTPWTRCGGCSCCGIRSPKKSRSVGSSMNGNCCGARDRSVDRVVMTAGETLLTKSAYEPWTPATPDSATGGGVGCVGARLSNLLCPLQDAKENATRT